jgi:hypothetical protein
MITEIDKRIAQIQQKLELDRASFQASVHKIADRMSYPNPDYNPSMAQFIYKAWIEDECLFYIPYGALRYGKTAYAMKTLAALYRTWEPEILKNFIVFEPQEFTRLIRMVQLTKSKYPAFLWDDGGIHLAALDWNDPKLKDISNYFQVVGTHFAGVIITSPLPTHVIKKIRGMPNCANIRIYKVNDNPDKPRIARGYYQWMAPDLKKTGVKPFINDQFSAIMPSKFYEWYVEYRRGYNDSVFDELQKDLYAEAQPVLAQEEANPLSEKSKARHTDEVIGHE